MTDPTTTPAAPDRDDDGPAGPLEAYLKVHEGYVLGPTCPSNTVALLEGVALTVGDLRAAVAAIRDRDATIARMEEKLDRAADALKQASSLYSCGYNERNAEDSPGEIDETGTSRRKYRRVARRLLKLIVKTREGIRDRC